MGIFTNVSSGCSYDPLSRNARRTVTDIQLPSMSAYPLKMTRYYNTRNWEAGVGLGPGWRYEYMWSAPGLKVLAPDGSTFDFCSGFAPGSSEHWETGNASAGRFRLSDGGTVIFTNGNVSAIVDPYGQQTTITGGPSSGTMTVMEPGKRFLKFIYGASDRGMPLLTRVEGWDGQGHLVDWVNYSFVGQVAGGPYPGAAQQCLATVTYSDGTVANYTYRTDNVYQNHTFPLLKSADDVRFAGPMPYHHLPP